MTKKFVIFIFSLALAIGLVSARPLVISASTTGTQITYTNNTSYTGNIWCYREQLSAYVPTNASNYQYSLYFQTDPGLYGYIQGYVGSTNESFSVAVQNGISEAFYSTSTSAPTLNFVRLVEYNQTLPQEVIDYIKNLDENVELTTELLDKLLSLRQWDIPIESYSAIMYHLYNYNDKILDTFGLNYYNYPLFSLNANDTIFRKWFDQNEEDYFIFLASNNIFDVNAFQNQFNIPSDISVLSVEQLFRYSMIPNTGAYYILKVRLKNVGSDSTKVITAKYDIKFTPIYINRVSFKSISTDFALVFGLSNQLLDDLHIVAQGTNNSNTSSDNLENSANEYGELADDVLGLEDDLGSGFSNSLNNVPTSFNFSTQFGNKFLHSATWVRTQFENLTTNTPFGTLITFSLVLGLALLLVGRRLL